MALVLRMTSNGVNNMFTLRCHRAQLIIIALVCIITLAAILHYVNRNMAVAHFFSTPTKLRNKKFSRWPEFENSPLPEDVDWYRRICFNNIPQSQMTIENFDQLQRSLTSLQSKKHQPCRDFAEKLNNIYTFKKRVGSVVLPEPYKSKVWKWVGNDEELFSRVPHQEVTHIFNEFTFEHTIYNPVRSKRPMGKPDQDQRLYFEKLLYETSKNCDFCNFKSNSAEDTFGRFETNFTFSAANTFKLDKWHSMILTKQHNILKYDEKEMLDLFEVALRWFEKVHEIDASFRYPMLVWDMTFRGGCSQMHPHIQVAMDTDRYYGQMEQFRVAADNYFEQTSHNYFTDLNLVHTVLGLNASVGDAVAIAPLTPKKDFEVIILSKTASADIFRLLYYVMKAYSEELGIYSFSLGMTLPELTGEGRGKMPALVKIVQRGHQTTARQDMSSLELFTVFNVSPEPSDVISLVKNSIEKRRRKG